MWAFFDFLFGRKHPIPVQHQQCSQSAGRPEQPSAPRKTKSFRLIEKQFDRDRDASDVMWRGYVLQDGDGVAVEYDEVAERIHPSVRIFKVAGVSYRPEALQSDGFAPGKPVTLRLENDNRYDSNAISVWDESGSLMVGYVPREENIVVRAILQVERYSGAIVLAEYQKGGKRVGLKILFAPMVSMTENAE